MQSRLSGNVLFYFENVVSPAQKIEKLKIWKRGIWIWYQVWSPGRSLSPRPKAVCLDCDVACLISQDCRTKDANQLI